VRTEHKALLEWMARVLLERRSLKHHELDALIAGPSITEHGPLGLRAMRNIRVDTAGPSHEHSVATATGEPLVYRIEVGLTVVTPPPTEQDDAAVVGGLRRGRWR